MSDYIKMWLEIIENMRNTNTYKLVWGRAILEMIFEMDVNDIRSVNVISFEDMAKKILKYYWNQVCFFHLKQGPGPVPELIQVTNRCIEFVQQKSGSCQPVWFDFAQNYLEDDQDFYEKQLKSMSNTLKKDVCWRFMELQGKSHPLYILDKEARTITLSKAQCLDLKEYCVILAELLNFRWAQLLEKFNTSPKIASKVKGISEEKLRRHSLQKYRDLLLANMKDGIPVDFYTGKTIPFDKISVDHVIPWSYMYSDDIWNLVLMEKSNNSSKGNSIPDEATIAKLEKRNLELVDKVEGKYKEDLISAIDNDYVRKFYISCKL